MTAVGIMRDVKDPLGHHLNQKDDLKSAKKWQRYCKFIQGRLRDSSEHHSGCRRSIRASFELKISKIRQETAELWLIYRQVVA